MAFDRNKPNNQLPPLPPKIDLENRTVLKKSIDAHRQLGELKGLAQAIPNPAILVNTIVLQEAQASSEIENIVTSGDRLFQAFASKKERIDPQTKEVLRYREAVWHGYNQLQKKSILTTNLLVELCQIIRQSAEGIRKITGTKIIRGPGDVVYTPPEGVSIIREKLHQLEKFIHSEDDELDPLVKLALIHYQFEAIHPFSDGNGRTGRILNILYLILNEYINLPILYPSQYIMRHKSAYYRLLQSVTEKDQWIPWIEYILSALTDTAKRTNRRIVNIQALFEETCRRVKKNLPAYMYSRELVELLFENPYCKVEFLVRQGIAKRQRASVYLKELEKTGILKMVKIGRENLFLNVDLWEILEAS